MFLLKSMIGYFVLAALLSVLVTALVLLGVFLFLRKKGLWSDGGKSRTDTGLGQTLPVQESDTEMPEELLVAILSAAVAAMGEEQGSRFRVVAFHRIK